MILEGIVTTLNDEGQPHVAPMGPRVDESMRTLLLRPFQTSHTFEHLMARPRGVFHVVDDVELLARAAIGQFPVQPGENVVRTRDFDGWTLTGACRWYAFEVQSVDTRQQRAEMQCRVLRSGTLREFFGLNRAMHAVVEAAILATRLHCTARADVVVQLERLRPLVEKTGGPREHRAFALLERFVRTEPDEEAAPWPSGARQHSAAAPRAGGPQDRDNPEIACREVLTPERVADRRDRAAESVLAARTAGADGAEQKRSALETEPDRTS